MTYSEENSQMNIDLAPFLAALIDVNGGEVKIPYQTFVEQSGEKALTIDLEDGGATMVLRVVDIKDVAQDE